MTKTSRRSVIGRTSVVVAGALCLLHLADGDPEQEVSLGPLDLDGRVALTFPKSLEPRSLFHDLCFELPQGYHVDFDRREIVAEDGSRGAVFALLRDSAGGTFVFSDLSQTLAGPKRWLCLSSPDLVGPDHGSVRFVAGEVRSTLRWHSRDVLWRSVEKV